MSQARAAGDETGEEPVGGRPVALPDAVRGRVVALAADALSQLAPEHLPPPLKRVASFTPGRRAKLAGGLIETHLQADEQFRDRVATQVHATVADLAQALLQGTVPPEADPVEVAAAAYLLRPEGWERFVQDASLTVDRVRAAAQEKQAEEQVARLRRRLEEAESALQDQRRRTKEQVDRLKQENADLRRKLGETRSRLRQADEQVEAARARVEGTVAESQQAHASLEAETRRLRSRVEELEKDLASARRAERASKVGETVRAKLLVDTLVEAATGLRRELGLPATDRLPADSVAADEGEPGSRTSSGRGSLPVGDPALLEELLRLPRAHLVVDGYNVTKTSWPELTLERQRERLLTGAAALQARTGAEVTVVFDAAETKDRPLVTPPRGVRVRFSPYGVIADDVIRELVAAEPPGRGVVVVTSDQAVVRDVVAAGFRAVQASALAALLAPGRP